MTRASARICSVSAVLRIPARQLNESSCAIRFREFAAVPARRPAALARKQPDLKQLERIFVAILLGMTDPRSALITWTSPATVRPTLPALSSCVTAPCADISDDFHVGVG